MTDKQIIIDGIDVSGCKHYKNRTCIADYCLTDMPFGEAKCELNPNCYYKQLKRKEQECNKLYIQLKADEEYHKEEENTLRKIIKNKEERNIELYKENNKLKQILAKIKEVCNNNDELQGDFNLVDCDKYKLGKHNLANKILQKISECEAEND